MSTDLWKKLGRGFDPDARDEFRSSLQVVTPAGPTRVDLCAVHRCGPKGRGTGRQSRDPAYTDCNKNEGTLATPENILDLATKITTKQSEIDSLRGQTNQLTSSYGTTDLDVLLKEGLQHWIELDRECFRLSTSIKFATETSKDLQFGADGKPTLIVVTPAEIDCEKALLALP
jgi:hypothetical protein